MKKNKQAELQKKAEMARLRKELAHTKGAIDSALCNFEQAIAPTMVDCYIYAWKAAQMR